MGHSVLLYDGVCGLCNRLVQFALRHDHKKIFRFASLQSSFGSRVLKQYGVDASALRAVYVLASGDEGQELMQQSEAILFLMGRFGGIWTVLAQMARLFPLASQGLFAAAVLRLFLGGRAIADFTNTDRVTAENFGRRLGIRVWHFCRR